MVCKDARMRLISEVMNGIKMVKLNGWEEHMKARISEERQKEINILWRLAYWNAATSLSWSCAPFVVAGESNKYSLILTSFSYDFWNVRYCRSDKQRFNSANYFCRTFAFQHPSFSDGCLYRRFYADCRVYG